MHPFERGFAKALLLLLLHCTAVITMDAFCARSNQMLLPSKTSLTQMKLYVDNSEGEEQPHSVWYNRYKEYQSDTLDDYDFVLNDRELIESDPALNLLSSEIGVKEYFTKQIDLSHEENIPFSVLAERAFDTIEDIFQHLQRIPYENGSAKITPEEELTRKTVVVLGSGWGAHALMSSCA
eukprot:scaffold3992_cov141-Skeletonema_dohrnii-CCMP3373.AAC.7